MLYEFDFAAAQMVVSEPPGSSGPSGNSQKQPSPA
jgi:hypothetical protein